MAQEAGGAFGLELNSVADNADAGSCRLIFVAENNSGTSIDTATYQVAIFDSEGTVTRLTSFPFSGLSEGRTKVFQFDLRDTPCGSLGRFVINDVLECTQSDGTTSSAVCMDTLSATSRTDVDFGM